jgi:hypothetical protein
VKPLSITPQSVGWDTVPEEYKEKSTDDLLKSAIGRPRVVKEFDLVQFRRRLTKIGIKFRQLLLPLLPPFHHGMAHHCYRFRRDRRLTDEPNLAICFQHGGLVHHQIRNEKAALCVVMALWVLEHHLWSTSSNRDPEYQLQGSLLGTMRESENRSHV